MEFNLRVFLIIFLIIGLIMIFKTIKNKNISMKYGMYWTLIFLIMLILIIFPNIIEYIANICGFKDAPNMLFLIAIFLLFYIVFAIYTSISKLYEINKSLVQEISILEEKINKK